MQRRYVFSDDAQVAKQQFREYTTQLVTQSEVARKRDTPLPYLRRRRLASVLCECWTRHAMIWGPDVIDLDSDEHDFVAEHQPYNYNPPSYDLQRLATMLVR